jgi:diacylglycerol kinase family enzyme
VALVNARAGEVLQSGRDTFAERISEGFQRFGMTCEVRFVEPRVLSRAVEDVIDDGYDALLVAGGDGTINHLLPQLTQATMPIGLLPLGTLNLLARDVGLEGAIEGIVARLARLRTVAVDLGEVNGRLFHSNAGLGFFARMAREREDARNRFPGSKRLGFAFAALRSLWLHRPIRIEIEIDGQPTRFVADALLVTNNQFHGADWRRDSVSEGEMEVHMLRASGMLGRLRAAIAVYRGTWRDLPLLESVKTRSLTVTRRGRRRSTAALDGEIYQLRNPIRFQTRPAALLLITGEDMDQAA